MSEVNTLIDAVDAAHGKAWQLWRAALGHWCIQLKPNRVLDAPTLEDALRQAAEWRDLPAVRREPTVLYIGRFAAVRDGSKWSLRYDGDHVCGNIATKARAMECAQGFCDRSVAAHAEWQTHFGSIVANGTEGVDFRYV